MSHKHNTQEAKLFRYTRPGPRMGADKRLSAETLVSALAAVALAFAAWSTPVSADEPMLVLDSASAPDNGGTSSEVVVSSRTDKRGRLVREITVRVVAIGEASPIGGELVAEPWLAEQRPLRTLTKEALYEAFRTADTVLDQTFEPLAPPPADVRQLPFVSKIAASESSGDVEFDVLEVQPDGVGGQMKAINAVPEPSTLVLFAVAWVPLWLREKRRRLVEPAWSRA